MQFEVKRQILKLVGSTIRTYDNSNQLIVRADQKGFKLKEQITFYNDEQRLTPLFSIKARNIIDISATYDIADNNGSVIGSLRRKGLRSAFVRDEWLILNPQEQQIGEVKEESSALGLLRRWIDIVSLFVPQKYNVIVNNEQIGHIQQNKNPLTVRLRCDFNDKATQLLGKELVLAIPNMLAIIEQRQN